MMACADIQLRSRADARTTKNAPTENAARGVEIAEYLAGTAKRFDSASIAVNNPPATIYPAFSVPDTKNMQGSKCARADKSTIQHHGPDALTAGPKGMAWIEDSSTPVALTGMGKSDNCARNSWSFQ